MIKSPPTPTLISPQSFRDLPKDMKKPGIGFMPEKDHEFTTLWLRAVTPEIVLIRRGIRFLEENPGKEFTLGVVYRSRVYEAIHQARSATLRQKEIDPEEDIRAISASRQLDAYLEEINRAARLVKKPNVSVGTADIQKIFKKAFDL